MRKRGRARCAAGGYSVRRRRGSQAGIFRLAPVEAIGRAPGESRARALLFQVEGRALRGLLGEFSRFDREDLIVALRTSGSAPRRSSYIAVYLIVRLFLKPRDPDYYRSFFTS